MLIKFYPFKSFKNIYWSIWNRYSICSLPCINMVSSPAVFRWIPKHIGRIGTVGWISLGLVESNKTDLIPRQEEPPSIYIRFTSRLALNQHISQLMFDRAEWQPITPFWISLNSIEVSLKLAVTSWSCTKNDILHWKISSWFFSMP